MRFFLAMFSHETNTFSNIPTDRRQFEARDLRYGGGSLHAYPPPPTRLRGPPAPSTAAAASPAGPVTVDVHRQVRERLLADLAAAGPVDGILLDLHGAMVVETADDGEGELLEAVRRAAGPDVPIAVTLDFHGNVTPAMVRHATLLHGYRTYPHVDMADRGVEATERLIDVVAGRLRPTAAFRQPRLLPPIGSQRTAVGPMRRLYDLAGEMAVDPAVGSISIFAGFPLADIADAGLSID